MPEISFLGCLQEFRIVASQAGKLIIEGPFFTADKVNLNGWGIPEDEAAAAAATFLGRPVRWCPDGITVVTVDEDGKQDVTPAEHYCDLIDSKKAEKGTILDVFQNGTDARNRPIYWHRSEITDPKTIKGIMDGSIPTNVSMWALGKSQDEDGMVRGVSGKSLSIVTEPAYTEAAFQWRAVAASLKKHRDDPTGQRSCPVEVTDDTLRGYVEDHLGSQTPRHSKGGSMTPDPEKPIQTTLGDIPAGASVMPGTINIYAGSHPDTAAVGDGKGTVSVKAADATEGEGDGEDGAQSGSTCAGCGASLPPHAEFCPKCGAILHPRCAGCGASLHMGAKFCHQCGSKYEAPMTGTTGDNTDVAAQVKAAFASIKDSESRQTLAQQIIDVQLSAGIIKPEDVAKTTADLIALPASVLEMNLTQFKALASKIEASSETGLRNLPAMVMVAGVSLPKAAHGYPPKAWMDAIFQRLAASVGGKTERMSLDTIMKYGKSKNFPGCSDFTGTYHVGKDLLPLP